jgi:hypothetical protein
MSNEEIITKIGCELITEGPDVLPTDVIVRGSEVALAAAVSLQPGDKLFTFSQQGGVCSLVEKQTQVTAEEWLALQSYSSIRLVTLLDLENKLAAAGKTSPKLNTARTWINGILAAFVQDPTPKSDWPAAPHTFEETTQEAFAVLTT